MVQQLLTTYTGLHGIAFPRCLGGQRKCDIEGAGIAEDVQLVRRCPNSNLAVDAPRPCRWAVCVPLQNAKNINEDLTPELRDFFSSRGADIERERIFFPNGVHK